MGKILNLQRRKETYVTPSGVEIGLLSMYGDHQALITNSDEKKRRNAIDEMLKDCIEFIGNNREVTMKDVEALLSFDRSAILFRLRQFSNLRSPNFLFDYEFPVTNNGDRRKQRYEVIFNKRDFPQRPAYWVMEKMVADYRKELGLDENAKAELTEDQISDMLEKHTFPVCYESYSEMLEKHKFQTVKLIDAGVEVHWEMLDGATEKKYADSKRQKEVSSHDQLLQRNPKYKEVDGEKENFMLLPIGKISTDDIEDLRADVLKKEADIDTSVVVQYREDVRTQANLNLITVPAFFFPSLAK